MMSDPFDADELWFAHLLASVPTPASLERAAARPARPASGRRRRYRTLALAGGLALIVGVLGGLVLGLTRAGDKSSGTPATSGGAPPARVDPGVTGDDIHQNVVLFGGRGPGGVLLADTWIWDGKSWSERRPLHNPGPRRAAALSSDPGGGGVLLVGGIGSSGELLADTWEWDGTDWRQLSPAAPPGPRAGALLVQDPIEAHVVLFGGRGPAPHGTTWGWNGATWTDQSTPDSPPDCAGSSMAYDDAFRRVVLITGRACGGPSTWSFDGHAWSRLNPPGTAIGGDRFTMAYHDATQLMVLASSGPGQGCSMATWTWDTTSWTIRHDAGSPRAPAVEVRDPSSRQPMLVSASGEIWTWSGNAWTVVAGASSAPGTCPTP
jgi:Galactose oxidase, central domain